MGNGNGEDKWWSRGDGESKEDDDSRGKGDGDGDGDGDGEGKDGDKTMVKGKMRGVNAARIRRQKWDTETEVQKDGCGMAGSQVVGQLKTHRKEEKMSLQFPGSWWSQTQGFYMQSIEHTIMSTLHTEVSKWAGKSKSK